MTYLRPNYLLISFLSLMTSFNIALNPSVENSIRSLDLVFIVYGLWLVRDVVNEKFEISGWILSLVILSCAIVILYAGILNSGYGDFPMIVRFFGGVMLGGALARRIHENGSFIPYRNGMILGAIFLVILSYLQVIGVPWALALRPVQTIDNTIMGNLRASGLSSHPNSNMASIVVASSYLLLTGHKKIWVSVVFFVVIVVFGYVATQTRSGLVIMVALTVFALVQRSGLVSRLFIIILLISSATILSGNLDAILGGRLSAVSSDGMTMADQADERFSTTIYGFISSFSNPFYPQYYEFYKEYGFNATHNGFVFMMLKFSVVISLIFVSMVVWTIFSSIFRTSRYPYHFVLISIVMVQFFEDASIGPSTALAGSLFWHLYRYERVSDRRLDPMISGRVD